MFKCGPKDCSNTFCIVACVQSQWPCRAVRSIIIEQEKLLHDNLHRTLEGVGRGVGE